MTLKTTFWNTLSLASTGKRCAAALLGLAVLGAAFAPAVQFVSGAARADTIAPTAGGAVFTDDQKKALGDIIKDYLVKNPEIMIDVQTALDEKTQKDQESRTKAFMAQNAKSIYRSPNSSVAGNPDGDITVVEFFDFNCGYCKHGLPEVQKLIQADKNVRVVFKELPILSKGSEEAAKAALAAKRQGKYWEFHQAMLGSKGQANEASSLKAAESLGLNMDKFKADMASDDVKNELLEMLKLAKAMGVNGTPHFLVGDKSIPGAPEDLHEQLEELVTDFRKNKCATC